MYERKRPAMDSQKSRRRWFWQWFLTNAVFNLVDVENMTPDIETSFKLNTLIFGRSTFFESGGVLYCLDFADGGKVPVYAGQIIKRRVVNPVIGEFTFEDTDDKDRPVYLTMLDRCQLSAGFSDIISIFADDLSDNDLTIRVMQFVKRLPTVFVAQTDMDKDGMEILLQKIADGETEVLTQSPLAGSVSRLDGKDGAHTPLSEFTEYQQYKVGQFYGMLGVNSVWNTKREHVAASENTTSEETARYNIADIVDNLNEQLDEVNKRFNTSFHVKLNVERAAELMAKTEDDPDDQKGGADDAENIQTDNE